MYHAGLLKVKDNEMASIKTTNKDYTLELIRNKSSIWNTENSFKYLCKISFKNNLNILVLDLILSEIDVFCLVDSVYSFIEFNMFDISIPCYSSKNINLNNYTISLKRIQNYPKDDNIVLSIDEYNSIYNYSITRLQTIIDESNLIDILDLIYFIFLIDIDDRYDNMSYGDYFQ